MIPARLAALCTAERADMARREQANPAMARAVRRSHAYSGTANPYDHPIITVRVEDLEWVLAAAGRLAHLHLVTDEWGPAEWDEAETIAALFGADNNGENTP